LGQVPVVVDGMTGTGKSTLVNHLAEKLNLEVMPEEFRDPYDLLNKYSQDSKWCYPMQLNFLMTRFIQYTVASDKENYILDRSIFSDPVYAKLYYEMDHLSETEYNNYLTFYDTLMETIKEPKCMIILTCSFDEVMNRIHERGREDELRLGKDYWWALHKAYTEHVENIIKNRNESNSKILEIDTENLNLDRLDEELEVVVNSANKVL